MKKSIYLTVFSFGLVALLPSIASAQVSDIFGAEILVYEIVERLSMLLWALAVMVFFWGLVKFIGNASDTAAHEKGKELIVWGIISFLILVSLWGIVKLVLSDTLGINSQPVCYIDKNGSQICP